MSTTDQNPKLAKLRERAAGGDQFALRALRCYRTDAELEAAERESRAADYTDGYLGLRLGPLDDSEPVRTRGLA